jgi:hypothetical protein
VISETINELMTLAPGKKMPRRTGAKGIYCDVNIRTAGAPRNSLPSAFIAARDVGGPADITARAATTGAVVPFVGPHIIDFSDRPPPLDDCGRSGWVEVLLLQAHVQIVAQQRDMTFEEKVEALAAEQKRATPARPVQRPTPQVVIEAIMLCVRERGVAALKDTVNKARLKTFDSAASAELRRRLAKLVGTKQ